MFREIMELYLQGCMIDLKFIQNTHNRSFLEVENLCGGDGSTLDLFRGFKYSRKNPYELFFR